MIYIAPHKYNQLHAILVIMKKLDMADEDLFDHVSFKLNCIHVDGKIIFYLGH